MHNQKDDRAVLRAPATIVEHSAGAAIAIYPASPNWIVTDDRGLRILRHLDGRTPLRDVVSAYAAESGLDFGRAWLHVDTFARDAVRQRFVSTDSAVPLPYLGRSTYLRTDQLKEFWIQVNDFCNLSSQIVTCSAGVRQGGGAVEWGRVTALVAAWVVTLPIAAALAGGAWLLAAL